MSKLILLVGAPGSGKTQHIQNYPEGFVRVSQDDQGKEGHLDIFHRALGLKQNIVIDRMNFSKTQRNRYLNPAKIAGYEIEIIVLHEAFDVCYERCINRKDHPTIKDNNQAWKALNHFFRFYERVEDNEADKVIRLWPDGSKPLAIICDLDGTLCNIDHRLNLVQQQKKNWKAFYEAIPNDTINEWCLDLIEHMEQTYPIVFCSGRPDDHKPQTVEWLQKYGLGKHSLVMRQRGDHREDFIIKEILLDFEILTKYTPYFAIDDRQQVVDMWRKRNIVTLQCAKGNF